MSREPSFVRVLMVSGMIALVSACGLIPAKEPPPADFQVAMRMLGASLGDQLKQDRVIVGGVAVPNIAEKIKDVASDVTSSKDAAGAAPPKAAHIAGAPIVDANSGESVAVTAEIERLVYEEIRKASPGFTIDRMNAANLVQADHILFGVIVFDTYQQQGAAAQKHYRVHCTIVERKSKRVVARAEAWIANDNLDYAPAALYRDSPMFPRDQRLRSLVTIAKSPLGSEPDREYYDSLETNALMAEAESAFDHADYHQSLTLFQKVVERPDGQVIKPYLGLYRSNIKLGDMAGAETAFARMLPIASAQNSLSTKFLFAVNSTDFASDRELRSQYEMWLRKMGEFFSERSSCVRIVGHSSLTGTSEYNDRLSLQRAEKIRDLIGNSFRMVDTRAEAVGMGFSQIIVGSGTDDARDALDRRVEVAVVPCT